MCHLLALLGAHHILHVSRIRVKPQITWHDNCMNRTCECTHTWLISTLTSPTEQVLFISIRETARPTGNWWEGLCSASLHSTTSVLRLLSLKPKWSQNTAASFAFSNASHLVRSCSVSCNRTTCFNNFQSPQMFTIYRVIQNDRQGFNNLPYTIHLR